MTHRRKHYLCPTCDSTRFDPDSAFTDGTGYECPDCSSAVFYHEL